MTKISIAGLLIGGFCGYVGIKALLPLIRRYFDSSSVTVGFDINGVVTALFALSLGILGGAVIGLFTALWLAR